jgi:hypothetical protein
MTWNTEEIILWILGIFVVYCHVCDIVVNIFLCNSGQYFDNISSSLFLSSDYESKDGFDRFRVTCF